MEMRRAQEVMALVCKAATDGLCEGTAPSPFRYEALKTVSSVFIISTKCWEQKCTPV